MLADKILNRESGIVLYGITPPKAGTDSEKQNEIAQRQIERLSPLGLDGLIVYDIQDETTRISEERPFPFMATIDGFDYCQEHLSSLTIPKIVYRSVGKYQPEQLTQFLAADPKEYLTVFVGVPSQQEQTVLSLNEAYRLRNECGSSMITGGVTIPERHRKKGDEHIRISAKHDQGCRFFVSQGVYDLDAAKSVISDCYYHIEKTGSPIDPIIFTFTPCGSVKTVQFMKWLGISIPRWLENDLVHSEDILEKSLAICEQNWLELKQFADEKNIPIGANVESVAIRKVEIDASIELVAKIQGSLK